jgi:hypothetical protein
VLKLLHPVAGDGVTLANAQHPFPPASCIGGHGTVPNEQNTQRSLGCRALGAAAFRSRCTHRKIGMRFPYTAPYPDSIGDHPGRNALIAIATDSTGQITGGQFIHLDRDGHARQGRGTRPTDREGQTVIRMRGLRSVDMRGRWRAFGDFGRLRLTLERANEVFRNEPIFHSLVSR